MPEGSPFAARGVIAGKDARARTRDPHDVTEEFTAAFKRSPMKRAKLCGLKRNAAVVLGNVGMMEDMPVLQQALDDYEPLVSEHVTWAIPEIANEHQPPTALRDPGEPPVRQQCRRFCEKPVDLS